MDLILRRVQAHLDPKRLHLILMPTEQCNFRCSYCYEDFKLGEMSQKVVTGIKRLLEKRIPGLTQLSISWFGGEPLAASLIIMDLSRFICQAVGQYPNLQYNADMTTNGYLLSPPLSATLCNLGIKKFQISIDGPEDIHNRTRVRKGGRGTFHRIWENLVCIRDSALDAKILLRVHFQRTTFPYLLDFSSMLNKEFGNDERFSILFKAIERLGGENDDAIDVLSSEDKKFMEQQLSSRAGRLINGRSPLYNNPKNEQICYACTGTSFVVRSNGRINKCTVALYSDDNDVGFISESGDIHVDNEKFSRWIAPLFSEDVDALRCPYVHSIR